MCLVSYNRTLYRGHGHLQDHVFPRELEIHICVIIKYLKGKDIDVYFFKVNAEVKRQKYLNTKLSILPKIAN